MFDFLKKKKNDTTETTSAAPQLVEESKSSSGFFGRLKSGLSKTRNVLTSGMANLFLGKKELNQDVLDDIETALLTADMGIETTQALVQILTQKLARKELDNTDTAFNCLRDEMKKILRGSEAPLVIPAEIKPFVILMIGINGAGKTTTIGKLTQQFKQDGKQVMLAAGDTFRAAAIEQLQVWGTRNEVPVISQQQGADTAAVIYDAMEAAKARKVDILIADTAGRLHTQSNLMAELQKVKRVLGKIDATAPHEVLIVLDATLGQNALQQVKQFNESLGVTGIVLTKLDGTAKGGIIFAIARQTGIPIRYIGVGEGINDLRPFKADEFVDALLG
jgi:fused signal recognition particle receptor